MAHRNLTRQSSLFPTSAAIATDESDQVKQGRFAAQMFEIHDDLLYACVTYGDGLFKGSLAGTIRGLSIGKALGYALLAFFTQRALGLYRLPYCCDRILSDPIGGAASNQYADVLRELTPTRVDTICNELRRLYEHTQQQLAATQSTRIVLRRCVFDTTTSYGQGNAYAQLLFRLASACERAGRSHLQFDMDILNSYGDDWAYSHFPVAIVQEIATEDILYCSNLIKNREPFYPLRHRPAVESGEWVVINRSPTGVVDIPVHAIQLNSQIWIDRFAKSMDLDEARRFIDRFEPVVLRTEAQFRHASTFHQSFLQLKWLERVKIALRVLRTGRVPH